MNLDGYPVLVTGGGRDFGPACVSRQAAPDCCRPRIRAAREEFFLALGAPATA